jgi:hypothetical protein
MLTATLYEGLSALPGAKCLPDGKMFCRKLQRRVLCIIHLYQSIVIFVTVKYKRTDIS